MYRTLTISIISILILNFMASPVVAAQKKKKEAVVPQTPVFYPELPNTPRLQFLTTYNSAKDIRKQKSSRFMKFVLGDEEILEAIEKPYGVVLNNNKMYVCDIGQGMAWVFDFELNDLLPMGHTSPGRLAKPAGLSVDDDGICYVADTSVRRVMAFSPERKYIRSYGDPETLRPTAVVATSKELYVCSIDEACIIVFDKKSGKELRRIGTKGANEGELFFPTNIALDKEGNVYVSDTGNARVQKFDAQGTYLMQYGGIGLALGSFTRPKGVAIDKNNHLFVVDAAFENIQIFDDTGKLLLFFGGPGSGRGNINLPAGISIDYSHNELFKEYVEPGYELDYLVLVTSHFGNSKVNVYGMLKQKEE